MSTATITAVTGLISAITGILWPVIAVGVLFAFRSPAMRALNRVTDNGGTIKVFGVEVNVGKATEEQQRLIEDLQKQVGTLRDAARIPTDLGPVPSGLPVPTAIAPRPAPEPASATIPPASLDPPGESVAAPPPPDPPTPSTGTGPAAAARVPAGAARTSPRLLWVDDHPENNRLIAASLRDRGFVIVDALDTAAALDRFVARGFDAVVSDMGRDTADAGVTLTAQIRALDAAVPIIIFCSIGATRIYGGFARQHGATLVTDSATLLMQRLLELQEEP